MSISNKISMLRDILESAETNIKSAKRIIAEIAGGDNNVSIGKSALEETKPAIHTDDGKIVEGVFDGQIMNGYDGNVYPVPANYASKSKLIPGDVLKLTIANNGAFIYKQIGPAPRKRVVGLLTYEDRKYKVMAESTTYNVLLASVTFFRAEPGDKVTIIVPESEESEWGAIENVLPDKEEEEAKNEVEEAVGAKKGKSKAKTKDEALDEDEDLDF